MVEEDSDPAANTAAFIYVSEVLANRLQEGIERRQLLTLLSVIYLFILIPAK